MAHITYIFLGGSSSRKTQAFIRIIANQYWHIVVSTLLVQCHLVAGQHIAIYNGPAAGHGPSLRNQVLGRQGTHFGYGTQALGFHISHPILHGQFQRLHIFAGKGSGAGGTKRTATLRYGALEQAFSQRRSTKHAYRNAAGRFAKDGHLVGVATKGGDVVLDPLQTSNLVEQSVVTGYAVGTLGTQLGMGQKAQLSHPIRHTDHHNPLTGQVLAIVYGVRGRSKTEPSPINPHHYRQLLFGSLGRGPYVEVKTVLTLSRSGIAALHGGRGIFLGRLNAVPTFSGLRRFPAQFTYGRSSKGDAFKHTQIPFNTTLNNALLHFHLLRC